MTLIGHCGLYASMNYTSFYETKQQNSKFRLHYVLLIFQAQQNQILINKLQLKSQYSLSSAFSQLQNKDANFQFAKTTLLSIFIHKYLAKQTVTIQENWKKIPRN